MIPHDTFSVIEEQNYNCQELNSLCQGKLSIFLTFYPSQAIVSSNCQQYSSELSSNLKLNFKYSRAF